MGKATVRVRARRGADDAIWYPFTQMRELETKPQLVIERGEGNYLFDLDGNKYLDAVSSLWTNVHGHNRPELNRAVRAQLSKIAHSTLLGMSNDTAIKLANKLIAIAPAGLRKVFYSDSGSTAVEAALKIAYQYFQQKGGAFKKKRRFISLEQAYHGDTLGSVSVGGIDLFHEVYQALLFDTVKLPSPHCYRCPYGREPGSCAKFCFGELEPVFKRYKDECCAVILEPLVQGAAGILVHPPGYLKMIRELCDRYNLLLIADEVAVGFGKTGTMFACEQEGVTPDILALAKGISGGYLPLAATLVTREIHDGFLGEYTDFRTFFHGHTYTGNALACSAALANIELFEKDDVLGKLPAKIARLALKLEKTARLKHVGSVRQKGIIAGIELVKDKKTKASYPARLRMGNRVILKAREMGLILRPLGDVIVLMPPLSIKPAEIDRICDVVHDCVRELTDD